MKTSNAYNQEEHNLPIISEEYYIDEAKVRLDCHVKEDTSKVLSNTSFLTYLLAGIEISDKPSKPKPDIIWYRNSEDRRLKYEDEELEIHGGWIEGEVQKLVVPILRKELEKANLHAFHAAVCKFRGKNVMFMTGEENHGKTMSLIECCRRGGNLIGAESIICDQNGDIRFASKRVFIESEERSKGTERIDKPSSHQGVKKFFGVLPDINLIEGEKKIDVVTFPDIDGNYDTFTSEMKSFEKEYQTFQCLSYLYFLPAIISSQVPMPIFDNDALRRKRAEFITKFTQRPYYFIRGSRPQVILDEVEKILESTT